MELPSVGLQCSFANCNQLDFLPLQCKCNQVFCLHHFHMHQDSCPAQEKPLEPTTLDKIKNVLTCSHPDCAETSLVPLLCEKCRKHLCIKHRHIECAVKTEEELKREKERYAAPVRDFNKAKVEVDKQIEAGLSRARAKGKNPALVNKVQLMKIKGKAKGSKSVPVEQRVYFNVEFGGKCTPVFVSKSWSLGRTIDAVAEECGAVNRNNQTCAKKLRLFKDNAEVVCENLATTMDSLINDCIVADGQQLLLKYE